MKKLIIVFILVILLGGTVGCGDTEPRPIKPYDDPTVENIIIEDIIVEDIIIG